MVRSKDLRTIAFPAISCGIYRYPLEPAIAIALHEAVAALRDNALLERVYFVGFETRVYEAYARAIVELADD